MRFNRSLILRAAFTAALLALGAAPAHAAQTGIVPDLTWGVGSQVQDQTAAQMEDLGADWTRLNISWSDWAAPREGSYSSSAFSQFDRGIDLARAAGYRVMVTVEESPSWARDSSLKNHPPRDNADLATFMAHLANRYEGKVEAYQVWNEPNVQWAWPTAGGPNAGEYARMLRTVAPAIRAADPNAKVVFAGLNTNDWAYFERAYDAVPDLGRYFDVMATHPYTFSGNAPEKLWRDPNGRISRGAFAGYRELRETMGAHGDTKPIWVTEFGWATYSAARGVTPQEQADYLVRALRCLEQDPYVEVAHWYNLRNAWWENDGDTWSGQLGLLYTSFVRKPAFDALKNYTPGTGTCTYSGPAAPADPPADPDPSDPDPVEPPIGSGSTSDPDPVDGEEEGAVSSLRLSMLTVKAARIARGQLIVKGRVGTPGKVRGTAQYGSHELAFAARPDATGRFKVKRRLRDGGRRSRARVTISHSGGTLFGMGDAVLFAAPRKARLRVAPDAALQASPASDSDQRATFSGTVAPKARGRLRVRVSYSREDGSSGTVSTRTRIRKGSFEKSVSLPADASEPVLYVVFAGDKERGIAGATVSRRLASG